MIYKKDYTSIMSEKLPKGSSGDYSIKKTTMQKGQLLRTYSPAGYFYFDYLNAEMPIVKLLRSNDIVMSDTPMEQEGLRIPTMLAQGRVLILGLGLGLFPTLLQEHNRAVDSILIVEKSMDVIKLVYPYIKSSKTDIRICDGKKYLLSCRKKYDFIFIDVWSAFTTTIKDIDEWTKLAERRLDKDGIVKCWLQELYDRIKDKLPKEPAGPTSPAGVHEPCLICGKKFRNNYASLCMDCADDMGISELFIKEGTK